MTKVIKRRGSEEDFSLNKIIKAITLANKSVPENQQMNEEQVQKVLNTVLKKMEGYTSISTEDINDFVEAALVRHNKYQISNTIENTSVPVTKVWNDESNQDGIRPTSISVQLQRKNGNNWENVSGKTTTLSANNNWSATFTGLDKCK